MIACIYKFSLEKENNKMAKLEGKVALITGAAVDFIPTDKPVIITVAGPVSDD